LKHETIQHCWDGSLLAENSWRISIGAHNGLVYVEEHQQGILLIDSMAWIKVFSQGFSSRADAEQHFELRLKQARHSLRVKSGQWQQERERLNLVDRACCDTVLRRVSRSKACVKFFAPPKVSHA
jgi:hypothetical protein